MNYGRAILKDVEGYVPGEQPEDPTVIKLNTNENPYPPSPMVMEALAGIGVGDLRKYPDPLSRRFRRACAELHRLPDEDWVIAGNGMDEVLAMAIRTFVDPGDTILSVYPTYSLYETLAQLHGANMVTVDMTEDYQLPEALFKTPARAILLPRPNAPSGVLARREDVERLCRKFNGIVVIDEAYVDFAEDHCMDLPASFDNVIVMRTFSKSFSMAGVRLGIGVAQPAIISEFIKTKDSYNLNAFSQAVGLAAVQDAAYMQANVAKVIATRTRLISALKSLGFQVPPSQSNFVLARWGGAPDAEGIFTALKARKIFVRYFKSRGLLDALRITVGTDPEIDALLEALKAILKGKYPHD